MAVASDSFTGVDLSRLPAPQVVEALDFETINSAALAQLQGYFPAFDATVESDPIVKLVELFAYRELVLRSRVNDAAQAVMVPYASGADLDNLGALFEVERYILTPADPTTGTDAVLESDDDFRRRIVLAPESYSVAGPSGAYIYHALAASSDVRDASVDSPAPDDIRALVLQVLAENSAAPALVTAMTAALDAASWPGEVIVSVLSRSGDGTAGTDTLSAVATHLSSGSIRPLTDHVTVQGATIVPFTIAATITFLAGPDSSVVMAQAQANLSAYLASLTLGRDVTRAGIIAALFAPGVQNVAITSPTADITINRDQAAHCTGTTITSGGTGE
jgi:phage-related baseplate assembly protein